MWLLSFSADYKRSFKWYDKKRPQELVAVLDNLDGFFKCLLQGSKPQQIQTGYLHVEPHGIRAIDQKGAKRGNLEQTRLYVYPDETTCTLYVLSIGNKRSQRQDISKCSEMVQAIHEGRWDEYGEENVQERPGDDPGPIG